MGRYILKRLLIAIPTIIIIAIAIFTLMYFTPGDPARPHLRLSWPNTDRIWVSTDRTLCSWEIIYINCSSRWILESHGIPRQISWLRSRTDCREVLLSVCIA